jgi:hypothetical protein
MSEPSGPDLPVNLAITFEGKFYHVSSSNSRDLNRFREPIRSTSYWSVGTPRSQPARMAFARDSASASARILLKITQVSERIHPVGVADDPVFNASAGQLSARPTR